MAKPSIAKQISSKREGLILRPDSPPASGGYSFLKCLVLFVFISFSCAAQDSLVRNKDLHFRSALERANYNAYFKDRQSARFVALLLDVRDTASAAYAKHIAHEIEAVVNTLKFSGIEKRKPKKKVREIYDYVHKTILKRYELIARFDEIFTNGTYNCVTATALYSMIFDALQVPYEIKEKPTHVYLLAYPNDANVLVETTTPMFGYASWDNQYKQNFLSTMKSLKLVSDEDLKAKSTDELFNKYYFTDKSINLEQLIGIHYTNDAIFRADAQDLVGCYEQIQKAWRFFPVYKTEYLLKAFGITAVSGAKLTPQQKCIYISQLSRLSSLGVTNDMIDGEFHNLTLDILTRNNNKTLYTECYTILTSNIDNKDLRNDISYRYNYEMGRTHYNQGNLSRAKPYFKNALLLQPNNVDMNGLFLNTLIESIRRMQDMRSVIDTLHNCQTTFPSLLEYKNFKLALSGALLHAAGENFRNNNPEDALKYLGEFEGLAGANSDLVNAEDQIVFAYLNGASCYQRKHNLKKAKELADKGLLYAPQNYALNNKSRQLSR